MVERPPDEALPLIIVTDITDEDLTPSWDKFNREALESRLSCMSARCGVQHYGAPKGPEACFEQAPKNGYSFLAAVGRRYLVTWSDENYMRVTADVKVSVLKMKPDEHMILQFTERPPLYPRLPIRTTVLQGPPELWGELEPEFGAWSPPPNVIYAIADHPATERGPAQGDVTDTYGDSCTTGHSFLAPELQHDPQVVNRGATPATSSKVKASGTTENGGMLHPFSSYVRDNYDAEPEYRSYCLAIDGSTDVSGTETYLEECATADNDDDGIYIAGSWKYGWNVEESAFTGTEQLALSSEPWYCLDVERDGSDDAYFGAALNSSGAGVFTYACDAGRKTQQWYYKEDTGEVANRGRPVPRLGLRIGTATACNWRSATGPRTSGTRGSGSVHGDHSGAAFLLRPHAHVQPWRYSATQRAQPHGLQLLYKVISWCKLSAASTTTPSGTPRAVGGRRERYAVGGDTPAPRCVCTSPGPRRALSTGATTRAGRASTPSPATRT